MPRPRQLFEKFDPITADFAYVRWIGDRKGIEEKTKTWTKMILDRGPDLAEWVEVLKPVHKRKIQILAFANNHYAGYGPGTIEQFRELWQRKGGGKIASPRVRRRPGEIESCLSRQISWAPADGALACAVLQHFHWVHAKSGCAARLFRNLFSRAFWSAGRLNQTG